MLFSRTFTLAEANALLPYLVDEALRLRTAFLRVREMDAAPEQGAASHAGEQVDATSGVLAGERAALEGEIVDALTALARAGATVRLDPPGIDVGAVNEGQRVRLHWLEGEGTFTLWRDSDGRLLEIDDPDAFGAPIEQ